MKVYVKEVFNYPQFINKWCHSVTDEETGEWGKLHNEEFSYPYSSTNIVQVIKSRRMRWTGHTVCVQDFGGKT